MTAISGNGNRLRHEKATVEAMIRIYCRGHGHPAETAACCLPCAGLLVYAHERLDKCVYGEDKPVCAKCPIHCYRPEQRQAITAVMRYAGPKMIMQHPVRAIRHLLAERKAPPKDIPHRGR